jgi:hypothetical protein
MNLREIATALGRRGGRSRARRLSREDRKRIAAMGGRARLNSLRAARRIADNLRYAAALVDLRGQSPDVTRLRDFKDRLPGIYPGER